MTDFSGIQLWDKMLTLFQQGGVSLRPNIPIIFYYAQRWKKLVAAVAPPVLIYHSGANFWFVHAGFKGFDFFVQFWAFLLDLHKFELFFAHN